MADTFEVTIDGKTVEATPDMTILKAAAKVGVKIPTLCYDPRLQPFGACRLCLVEVEQMKGRLIPSCSTPVSKGMIVHTQTDTVRKARRMVLELLMIHHPLDCPVCDKAGECKLQDSLFEYGDGENRMMYGQVKFHDTVEARSHLIERDTNRCILCGLCVRVCDEVQSTGEINFVGRGFPTRVGTCFDKQLNCEFCGQCISICPVGALNAKEFKHKVRSWDLESTTTTCGYCGVGCTFDVQTRKGRIYRVKADYGKGINEGNLCGKGRFGWEYVHDAARLTAPMVRKGGKLVEVSWDEAIQAAASGMKAASEKDAASVALLATPRVTNEDAFLAAKLAKDVLGVANADTAASHYVGPALAQAKAQLGQASSVGTFADIHKATAFVVVNSSTQETNPVVGNRIIHRRRFEETCSLTAIHPRRMKMARYADTWLAAQPEAAADVLSAMASVIVEKELIAEGADGVKGFEELKAALADYTPAAVAEKTGLDARRIEAAAEAFAKATAGMVVLGAVPFADQINARTATAAINLLLLTGNVGKPGAGLLIMAEKNNMQGVIDSGLTPADGGMSAREIVTALDDGRLNALYLVGENVLTNFPAGADRAKALEGLDFLVVHEMFATDVTAAADVVFPAAALSERGGTATNSERRVQRLRKALDAPGEARADGDVLIDVAKAAGADWSYKTAEDALADLTGAAHGGQAVDPAKFKSALCQADLSEKLPAGAAGYVVPAAAGADAPADGYPLKLEIGPVLYHSGTLSVRSPQLAEVFPKAMVELNTADAADLGIADGDAVSVTSAGGSLSAQARVTKNVAKGSVFFPFHFADAPALTLAGEAETTRVKVAK